MSHEKHQELLQILNECKTACSHAFDDCVRGDDVKWMAGWIPLDVECADICGYLEQASTRNSPFIKEIAESGATICDACGKECEQHSHDHCQRCAEACFKCAEACRKIA